jgi:uncharacterized protein
VKSNERIHNETLNQVLFLSFLFLIAMYSTSFSQAVTNGYTKFYYPDGKVSSEGLVRQGKPDGYWKDYYENGKLKSEGNRKDFLLDSVWKFYNAKGMLYLSYNYKNGKKNGFKTVYSADSKDSTKVTVMSKESFSDDTLQGLCYYYEKGKLHRLVNFKNGLAEGKAYEFSNDSLITSIILYKGGFIKKVDRINRYNIEGRKDGLWQTFYPNGYVKWEGTYVDGKKDGYFKTYLENGDLNTIEKYINNVLQKNAAELAKLETTTEYFPNGEVKSSGPVKNGLNFGTHRTYDTSGKIEKARIYDSGKVVAEGVLDNADMQQGEWKEYYENGEMKAVGNYSNGAKVGIWKYFYSAKGSMFETGEYDKKGRPKGKWLWYYEDGKVRRESNFQNGIEDGIFIERNDSGGILTQGQYLEGLREGVWEYHLGNYKDIGKYTDDMQDSVWSEYYVNNGKPRFIGDYKQGRPDGKHTWYYPDGKIMVEGEYSMGLKEDKWKYYTSEGSLFLTISYKDDVETHYDAVAIKP